MDTTTLTRTLRLPSLVLFGLAYLTPIIVLGIFGVIAETSGGAAPASYLVALAAMLLTAHSYGRMAAAFPVAGSATRTSAAPSTPARASSSGGRCCWTTCSCPWSSG